MNGLNRIIPVLSVFFIPFLIQCDGNEEDDGQAAKNFRGAGDDKEAAFFSAPTEYGYLLEVADVEGESYLALWDISGEAEALRAQGDGGELVAFNYWNNFVYFGEMIEGTIADGGVCRVEVLDMESVDSHVLCVVETGPADSLYGQVIAAAGLVFIVAETSGDNEVELSISCFDIETGEDIAEWSGTGEAIEFISGCGTATPETVFFQVYDGHKYTLLTRERRVFVEVYEGLSGRFDAESGYWLFAKEVFPDIAFAEITEEVVVDKDKEFPGVTGSSVLRGYPVYYSYRLTDGEVAPLFSVSASGGCDSVSVVDGDPTTAWRTGDDVDNWVRLDFAAPLRIISMYLLLCNPILESYGDSNRVKKVRVELSSMHARDVEIPDELSLFKLELFNEREIPPEITWIAVTVLEVYEGEKDGGTVIAEITFDVR
ncbi:MAG: hypothetical protein GY771_13455 [bacterium]|nr:hypothetical protein [bacterium]